MDDKLKILLFVLFVLVAVILVLFMMRAKISVMKDEKLGGYTKKDKTSKLGKLGKTSKLGKIGKSANVDVSTLLRNSYTDWAKINKHILLKISDIAVDKWSYFSFIYPFERFLLAAAVETQGDFSKPINERVYDNFKQDLITKKVPAEDDYIKVIREFISKQYSPGKLPTNASIDNFTATLTYASYNKTIRKWVYDVIYDALPKSMSVTDRVNIIAAAAMKYDSILSHDDQWSLPLKWFRRVDAKYNISFEGFATPFNSRALVLKKPFCSNFPETDKYFGSMGNLLYLDPAPIFAKFNNNVTVVGWPPSINIIMNRVIDMLDKWFAYADKAGAKFRFILYTPDKPAEKYYERLDKFPYVRKTVRLMKGDYSIENLDNYSIIPIVNASIYVMDNFNGRDYDDIGEGIVNKN